MKLELKVDLEFEPGQLDTLLKAITRRARSMVAEFDQVVMDEAYVQSVRSTMKAGFIELVRRDE